MSVLNTGLAKSSAADAYEIDNSCRFNNPDVAYLVRTPSSTATSSKIFTISCWVKKTQNDQERRIFTAAEAGAGAKPRTEMAFYATNGLNIGINPLGSAWYVCETSALYRDNSSWYHIVWSMDTSQATPADRSTLYVNGVEVTDFSANTLTGGTSIPQDSTVLYGQSGIRQAVGAYASGNEPLTGSPYDGYIAEFYFVDGVEYAPSVFAETNSTTNQWIPLDSDDVKDAVTFGTNGFYQKYGSTEEDDVFADSSGGFMPTAAIDVEYLIVGGGGGAGRQIAGGGGAGGYRTNVGGTAVSLASGVNYTVTVGAGGSGSADISSTTATSGGNSSLTGSGITTISASGGGAGSSLNASGVAGGSGGGAAIYSSTGGTGNSGGYSPVEGYAGGNSTSGGGGGGGASEVGANSPDNSGGDGGDGVANSITGASVTYAGGGGGGGRTDGGKGGTAGAGGSGGGGAGTNDNSAPVAGTDGLGGGGGASGYYSGSSNGADGGSGVVIISYISTTAKAVGGTITSYTDGGDTYQVHTFTSSAAPHTITDNGDVTNTRAQKKVGDSSIKFDGTGDYLLIPASSDFDFGSSNWTFECWARLDSVSSEQHFLTMGEEADRGWRIITFGPGGTSGWSSYRETTATTNDLDFKQGSMTSSVDTWYHLAFVRNSGTLTFYVDGTSVGTPITGISGDFDTGTDSSQITIGAGYNNSGALEGYFSGYMDEIRISDTARYTTTFPVPTTAFTADANTLLLIHSNWDGGLGADSSGNYNTFTPTNLVATDQMIDTPTNNFATMSPIDASWVYATGQTVGPPTFSEGNLKLSHTTGSDGYEQARGTIAVQSGKWYFEALLKTSTDTYQAVGIATTSTEALRHWGGQNVAQWVYQNNGNTINGSGGESGFSTYAAGDIISVAFDCDAGKVWWAKNGTWEGSGVPASGTNARYTNLATQIASDGNPVAAFNVLFDATSVWIYNFGSDSSFSGEETAQGNQDGNSKGDFYYAPPSGFLALCTDNLSAPEIKLPGEYFNPVLYTGNGSTQTISSLDFQPDFVWLKNRDDADSHGLFNSVMGAGVSLKSNDTSSERPVSGSPGATDDLYAFTSNGFSVGTDNYINVNENTKNYVSWNWKAGEAPTADNSAGAGATPTAGSVKIDGSNLGSALAGTIAATRLSANTTSGFSIVTYEGTEAVATVAHGLSQAPELILFKNIDSALFWPVYSKPTDATDYLILNTDYATADSDGYFNDTEPTSTVFSLGDKTNLNRDTCIAYCFHSIEGYSKVGSYEGNGNLDGTFVYTGFRPAFVMTKSIDSTSDWQMFDNKRIGYNIDNYELEANDSAVEDTSTEFIDIVSNGFKNRDTTDPNVAETYLYIAFAESPFKYSNAR